MPPASAAPNPRNSPRVTFAMRASFVTRTLYCNL
jgi:hypothetical protein